VGSEDDLPVIREAYRLARHYEEVTVHLVHVISAAEGYIDAHGADLAVLDGHLRDARAQLWEMHERIAGQVATPFGVHVDVRIGQREEALIQAADSLAAQVLLVGCPKNDPGGYMAWHPTLTARLSFAAPCSVLVVRPNETRDVPKPVVEPPPAPGVHEREIETVHTYRGGQVGQQRASVGGTFGKPA
jgi:hypothetical protein